MIILFSKEGKEKEKKNSNEIKRKNKKQDNLKYPVFCLAFISFL